MAFDTLGDIFYSLSTLIIFIIPCYLSGLITICCSYSLGRIIYKEKAEIPVRKDVLFLLLASLLIALLQITLLFRATRIYFVTDWERSLSYLLLFIFLLHVCLIALLMIILPYYYYRSADKQISEEVKRRRMRHIVFWILCYCWISILFVVFH